MKHIKQAKAFFILAVFVAGFTVQSFAQVELPEVTVVAVNYKYLKSVDNKNVAMPVRLLERQVAAFDLKSSEYYEDDYDTYFISFYIPEGYILAAYNKDGKLLRTAEKFKDVALPPVVRQAVGTRYPGWIISNDIYLVNYHESKGVHRVYKILLENGNKRMRVKANEKGEII